jgi:hypothetical protein
MFAPLVDFFTGRSSAWKAKYEAAFVTLVNPDTGEPYTASGGGGGGGLADLLYTDDTGTVFVYRDVGSGVLAAINVPAGTAYTVGANPRPWSPPTQAVTGPLTDTQLRATAVPVSAASLPLPTDAATETTLAAVNTKVPSQITPGLLPVDTLGTPAVARVQATSGTAASIVLTTTCRRLSMYATTGTWYSISGTATSSSHYIGASERLDIDVPASTTVSVLQDTSAGSIRITELT